MIHVALKEAVNLVILTSSTSSGVRPPFGRRGGYYNCIFHLNFYYLHYCFNLILFLLFVHFLSSYLLSVTFFFIIYTFKLPIRR